MQNGDGNRKAVNTVDIGNLSARTGQRPVANDHLLADRQIGMVLKWKTVADYLLQLCNLLFVHRERSSAAGDNMKNARNRENRKTV